MTGSRKPAEQAEDVSKLSVEAGGEVAAGGSVRGSAAKFTRNSVMNVGRLLISTAAGFVLPTFLIHRLPVTTYSAWVLILQMSAYINYLDFGIQSGISKYVAEYDVRDDAVGLNMRASAGLALLLIVSSIGVILTLALAWQAPHLFHEMPAGLYRDVRLGLIYVGVSTSFSLLCSIFASIFTGLQRFAVPTVLSTLNRLLFVAVVLIAVALHSSLAMMGAGVAAVNVITGVLQFGAWRRYARRVRLSLRGLDYGVLWKMVTFCSAIAVLTVAMLCISGLDVTLVGRYDFRQTAFYSIASTPTNFIIGVMGAALAPLLPSASALSVMRSPRQMGELLAKATRYASTLLVVSGVVLLVGGYWLLRVWLGAGYAVQIVGYLRILVVANVLRNMCAPYANMLVATDSQRIAIVGATAEAVVNLGCSIYLARHIGAMGVAYGTLLGSFVGVGMHFGLSMHYTYAKLTISRVRLFLSGMGRPLMVVIPTALLAPRWWRDVAAAFSAPMWLAWAVSTLLLLWFVAIDAEERDSLVRVAERRLRSLAAQG